jgi:N-acetylneuraminate synthase
VREGLVKGGFRIGSREVGGKAPPLVIAEVGINHGGDMEKARRMVRAAAAAGCECVKFQCHILEEEMIPNDVVPGNAGVSIWDVIAPCCLTAEQESELKALTEASGMLYLCTPFSLAAVRRLEGMGVQAYKIGSGECNNLPLIEMVAGLGKPVIVSTGMNGFESIDRTVATLTRAGVPYALLHCTSVYPTPYHLVRLGAIREMADRYRGVPIGLSDHSIGNYTALAAVALGASIVEKHFTATRSWTGPDIGLSLEPDELRDLIAGARAIHEAAGGRKEVVPEEAPTIAFAYASIVSVRDIQPGEVLDESCISVKRPGRGGLPADRLGSTMGRKAGRFIPRDRQIKLEDLE